MATHPLSFCEALEDEYRYFFGKVPYGPIKFERKQVREIGDLSKRLDLCRNQPGASRWHLLARYVAQSANTNREEAILEGLQLMLSDPTVLNALLGSDDKLLEQIAAPEVWRELRGIPVARRLLM